MSRFTKVADAVIQWTPAGGSGGLLIHFLWQQEWLQAALMFPVMLVTVVWAKYTENFIETFGASAGERGTSDARSLAGGLSQLNKGLQWRFSGANDRYRRAQAIACQDYRIEGVGEARWNAVPMLEEVYVPLGLRGGFAKGGFVGAVPSSLKGAEGLAVEEEKPQYIWDLLRQSKQQPGYRRIAVIARGGFGKTTLLRHIAYRYGLNPHRICREKQVPKLIPVLLYLRVWREVLARADAPDLPTLIADYHVPQLPGKLPGLDADWAKGLLSSGRALVMIDGFDEVAANQCEEVSRWIDAAIRDYGKTATFILTSRPAGYERYSGEASWTPVEVKEFDAEQRNDFLQRWYYCQARHARGGRETEDVKDTAVRAANNLIEQIERREELAKMADNPLLLCMIATYHRFHPTRRLPIARPRLYQGFCQMLLEDRPASKDIEMALSAEKSQAVLQGVALEMVQQDRIALPMAEMAQIVDRELERCTAAGRLTVTDKFIEQIEEVSELFVRKQASDEYEFAHRSFQEYLAAMEIKRRQEDSLLVSLSNEWRDTAVLYAALANDPTSLIEQLCDKGDREALDLAYDCWLEKQDVVPLETFKRLQTLCYAQLEHYMTVDNWEAADQYTYRLMTQVLGKRWGDYFSAEELITFPCDDLLRIDRLWTMHSQGRFGFSVQKDIYIKCGGVLDGKYHEEPLVKFIQAVDWCKVGTKQYDSLSELLDENVWTDERIFSLKKGVCGHLPDSWVLVNCGVCLFFRIQTCEL
ncbi:MAG: GUN4 domain-containing protein [Phormidesmis sp.]